MQVPEYELPWYAKVMIWLVAMAAIVFLAVTAEGYTVQKGDTLSGIALRELGDLQKWKDLAEWNDLEIEHIDGVAYVWLKINQEIQLTPAEERLSPMEVLQYTENTKALMEKEIFRMAGIKNPSPRWNPDLTIRIILRNTVDIRRTIFRLRQWIKEMEIQGRYRMVDEIEVTVWADQRLYKFFPGDPYWVQHRKVCLFLVALLDAESNGYFTRSHAGAYGPWQFLPGTYRRTTGDTRDPRKVLMEDSLAGLKAAILYLGQEKTKRAALVHYNPNTPGYVREVLASYYKMVGKCELLDEGEDERKHRVYNQHNKYLDERASFKEPSPNFLLIPH